MRGDAGCWDQAGTVLPASSLDVLRPGRGQGKLRSRSPTSPAFPLPETPPMAARPLAPGLASLEPQP